MNDNERRIAKTRALELAASYNEIEGATGSHDFPMDTVRPLIERMARHGHDLARLVAALAEPDDRPPSGGDDLDYYVRSRLTDAMQTAGHPVDPSDGLLSLLDAVTAAIQQTAAPAQTDGESAPIPARVTLTEARDANQLDRLRAHLARGVGKVDGPMDWHKDGSVVVLAERAAQILVAYEPLIRAAKDVSDPADG
jgi:hypothetical protein